MMKEKSVQHIKNKIYCCSIGLNVTKNVVLLLAQLFCVYLQLYFYATFSSLFLKQLILVSVSKFGPPKRSGIFLRLIIYLIVINNLLKSYCSHIITSLVCIFYLLIIIRLVKKSTLNNYTFSIREVPAQDRKMGGRTMLQIFNCDGFAKMLSRVKEFKYF